MCITHSPARPSATASTAPGARKPFTSLIMSAPAANAARITPGFSVSIDNGTFHPTRASRTGISRSSSCCPGTAAAPGRVDSAPRSSISAPSAKAASARRRAASRSPSTPSPENEASVRLMMAMMRGRDRSSSKRPQTSVDMGELPS
ncbi:hypothetical protein SDC9_210314 [bioreactor metagenome]|uniref:Uncharacterized protein n=1 Tax=bioreactor metagenome TaxID=1076179 RepID=A0A645JFU5_9ZZZZ